MLSTEQKAGQLYKHFLNVSDTRDTRDFYEEAIQSSFCIRPDQLLMYGDEIPRGESQETVDLIRNLGDGEYYNWQKDETTVIHVVQRHINYPLKKIDDGTDNAFKLVDDNGELIQNVIPFNYYKDLYNYDLRTNAANGSRKIYFGVGDWVLDTYSGVLKFYGDVPPGVDHNNPPTISFYQYVGGTGFRQDTFGYDGVIVPITGWHISAGTYIIDKENLLPDDSTITLEGQVSSNANAIQDGYTGIFGFDGNDTNEGVAYSLQKVISLTYASSLDNVKGYDDSANSDIGTLLTRKKATVDAEGLKVTFCSQNVSVVKEHKLVVANGTVSFDGGLSKTVSGITKVMDTEGNFLIIEGSTDTLADGEYPVEVIEDTTSGILLYWSRSDRDYVPFINKEDDYYNFGFPVVAANGRIPPSVGIGAITLNNYTDSITPEYYGPRNYTVTVALEDGDQVKSADYIVKNNTGAFLDDILKRIISDYTDSNGNLRFTGSIFLRAGSYALSESDLDLSDFQFLNLIGEDKGTTKIVGGLKFTGLTSGITTVSNLTLTGNITFNTTSKVLYLNETVFKNFTSTKDENVVCIKNSSMDSVTIKKVVEATPSEPTPDEGATPTEGEENQEPQESQEPEDTSHQMFNIISGSIIGNVNIDTGHTLLTGDTIGILKLHDVLKDVIKACFIQKVISKPRQTTLVGSTVFEYEDTPFTQIPHMCHFPIYSKDSDKCLEYATFDNPFRINYSQEGNTITIALDEEYLYIDDEGRLSCNLNAGSIIVDRDQLHRNPNYEGPTPEEAIPNKNLQEALNDLYSTKADLNPNGKIPLEEIPDSVAYGGLLFVGTWSFEYQDAEAALPGDNGYVDGGGYPSYADASKNLTIDKTQDEGLEPGWFWIVSSSRKDDDKPAAIQHAIPQEVTDADGNVIYKDEGLVFTAGDWVIWNGTNFEKLDRAYQDAAYAVLPIYTTGEHLCWSWKDNEDGKKWGLGALTLGGETIAESFDLVNQELRKLWVKHPGILGKQVLVPFEDEDPYKTLDYIPLPSSDGILVNLVPLTAYDIHKDERVKKFRVKVPKLDPKWKSSIFVGDGCTFTAAVDGVPTTFDYEPQSGDFIFENVRVEGAFDPFDEEISGSNYWKSVYLDFYGTDIKEGAHKFFLKMDDITPKNDFTKDAISQTPVFNMNAVDKYDYKTDGFNATIDTNTPITINGVEIKDAENEGYCSGVPSMVKTMRLSLSFLLKNVVDCVNTDLKLIQFVDEFNGITVDIPLGNIKWAQDSERLDDRLYSARVTNFIYDFPVDKISTEQNFSLVLYDVYKNFGKIENFLTTNMRLAPGLNEKERILSGSGLYPTTNIEIATLCGGAFDSSKSLKDDYKTELMKDARTVNGEVIQDYGWPEGTYQYYSGSVDYSDLTDSDKIVSDEFNGDYRWVTFGKCWNGEDYEEVILNENSGFTLDINVADDVKDKFIADLYSMSTSNDNLILMAKFVDFSKTGDCSLTPWFNCNAPYDGFAKVCTENGQASMYAGSSNALTKRITFGKDTQSGRLIFRVGIKKDSGLRIKNLTVRDLI